MENGPFTPMLNPLLDIALNPKKASRTLYHTIVNDYNDQPSDRYDKWMSEITVDSFETDLDWYNHINEGYRCTKSVELHSFQYKYFMRDLATRRKLNIMNIVPDNKCIKCNKHAEDVIHMFWGCKHVRKLWLTLHTVQIK